MRRCLQLAYLGAGMVTPNPMVGAVLVYKGKIIGEGYHQSYGKAHAEVNCINSVCEHDRKYISQSTLYVSLEPCAHFGKTPPCVDLIINNKIPVVVVGCTDIFSAVNGKGIEKLKAAGVNVITNILQKEAQEINKRFFTFHQQQRPYVILKWAQSNNGKIAGADYSKISISNELTNKLVHKWRSEEAAILIGTNTALYDNPALTTRFWSGKSPIRLVIDMELKLPASLHLFNSTEKTIIFNGLLHKEEKNYLYYKIDNKANVIGEILHILYLLKIQSVMVEGGAKLLQSCINENLWDEMRVITNSELMIDMGIDAPILASEVMYKREVIASDIISYYTHA